MAKPGQSHIFHGWKMAGAASAIQFLSAAVMGHSFGAYVAVLRESLGWSKTALAGAAVVQQIESALLGPIQGWLVDRFGPRGMIRIGVVLYASALMLLSQVESLAAFYGCFALLALSSTLSGFFPLSLALINWFERQRSRALSCMSIGMAVGGMAVPLVAWSLEHFGWRATAFASGVLYLVVAWPLAGVMRNRPADYGEHLDGVPAPPPVVYAPGPGAPAETRDFTAVEAMRTPAFWLVSAGHGIALLAVSAVNVHMISHLKEAMGYSLAAGAAVMGVITTSQLAGILLGWWFGDRYDKRNICAACMLAHMTGLLLLTYAPSAFIVTAAAVLHGAAWGLRGPFMQSIRADYFGRTAIGLILGISSLVVVIGMVGGPLFAGYTADLTGNYRLGFTLIALAAGLGSLTFLFARQPPRPLRERAA